MTNYRKLLAFLIVLCMGCEDSGESKDASHSKLMSLQVSIEGKLRVEKTQTLEADGITINLDYFSNTKECVHYLSLQTTYPMTKPTKDDEFQKSDISREKTIVYTPRSNEMASLVNGVGFHGITNYEANKPTHLPWDLIENGTFFPLGIEDGKLKKEPIKNAENGYFGVMPNKNNASEYALSRSSTDNITIELMKDFLMTGLLSYQDNERGISFVLNKWL